MTPRRRACPAYDCDACEYTYTRVTENPPSGCPRCGGVLKYIGWLVGVDGKDGKGFELVGDLVDWPEPRLPGSVSNGDNTG